MISKDINYKEEVSKRKRGEQVDEGIDLEGRDSRKKRMWRAEGG